MAQFSQSSHVVEKGKAQLSTQTLPKRYHQIMDLNVIIFEREFASEKVISSKVLRAINGKSMDRFKC